jgi:hypothetical protein
MYRVVLFLSIIIFLLTCTILSACSSREVILPTNAKDEVKNVLGYVVAPTYLPKGLEFDNVRVQVMPKSSAAPDAPSLPTVIQLTYSSSEEETGGYGLLMYYPTGWPPNTEGPPYLKTPEDAISEVDINNRTAYMVRGTWSDEFWSEWEETGEVPFNPEWDYDIATSLLFAFDLPGGETIGIVLVATPDPAATIGNKELVKIAEYIVIVY